MEKKTITLKDYNFSYLYNSAPGKPKLMMVHGNVSSSVFYEDIIERMAEDYEIIAPDMRCFGDSDVVPVDATRGMRDFSDDLYELTCALGWDKVALFGWSLGGGVVMQYAIDHADMVTALILEAPVSPFGFGGTYDEDGKKLQPAGIGSGAGCVNQQLVQALLAGDKAFALDTFRRVYVKPPFSLPEEIEDKYAAGILSTKIGEGLYPGDFAVTTEWPGVIAGTKGICNTMAPMYCDLSNLADINAKFPILWLRGDSDIMSSDNSLAEFGTLGQLGIVPGWPGIDKFPPQPMVSQTRYVLEKYKANGGTYKEVIIENAGHGPHLEHPELVINEIKQVVK